MSPRIAVVGGGPGGLFLATLLRRALPEARVTLFERNRAEDAFGFGVVFSDATLRKIDAADPILRDALAEYGRHWDRIEVWSNGQREYFAGNGMAAIHRKVLLRLLQENAAEADVDLRFATPAPPIAKLAADYHVVVGADGTNSVVRDHLGEIGQSVETARAKFIWFATTHLFNGLTFVHRVSEHGNFAVHGYPISDQLSTFIVETDEDTWRAAGMDEFDVSQPPGASDLASQGYLEKLFAEDIGGASLVANNSRWGNFRTRRTQQWYRDNVVLLGDAVHTAHFSVGSGTKMAMEDAVALADHLASVWGGGNDLESALSAYQAERTVSVAKIQDAARPSLAWWERFGSYQRYFDPTTFAFHFFSRSIGVDKIAQRDPELVSHVRDAWLTEHGTPALESTTPIAGQLTGRLLRVTDSGEALRQCVLVDKEGRTLVVAGPDDEPAAAGARLVRVQAPADEAGLTAAFDSLPSRGSVLVSGRSELPKILLSEHARLRHGLVTVIEGHYDDAAAETLLLAGRADAVAAQGMS